MIYTLGQARDFCSEFVDNGYCPTAAKVTERINEAIQMLLNVANWKHTTRRMRFLIRNTCLTCPPEVDKILAINLNNQAAHVWSRAYEFLEGGPRNLVDPPTWAKDLVDLGTDFPTQAEIPLDHAPLPVIALCTEEEDEGKILTLFGTNMLGEQIIDEGMPGTQLAISRWKGGVEGIFPTQPHPNQSAEFHTLQRVIKPVTKGYVSLYAWDPDAAHDEYGLWFLSKYAPWETHPGYRRYKVMNGCWDTCDCAVAEVKLAYVPAVNDDDVLLIQSLPAIKMMAMAIRELNAKNLNDAANYQGAALSQLVAQRDSARTQSNVIHIEKSMSLGSIPNLR